MRGGDHSMKVAGQAVFIFAAACGKRKGSCSSRI